MPPRHTLLHDPAEGRRFVGAHDSALGGGAQAGSDEQRGILTARGLNGLRELHELIEVVERRGIGLGAEESMRR